jgi:WD40 repeat protein
LSVTEATITTLDHVTGEHTDVVTCVAVSSDGKSLVTGSRDTQLILWELSQSRRHRKANVNRGNRKILYGHEEEVSSVWIDADHDLVLSGSVNGVILMHSMFSGEFIRSVSLERPPMTLLESFVSKLLVTKEGTILVVTHPRVRIEGDEKLDKVLVMSMNGRILSSLEFSKKVTDIQSSNDGRHVILSVADGSVNVYYISERYSYDAYLQVRAKINNTSYRLKLVKKLNELRSTAPNELRSTTCLSLSSSEFFVQQGHSDGSVTFVTLDIPSSPS